MFYAALIAVLLLAHQHGCDAHRGLKFQTALVGGTPSNKPIPYLASLRYSRDGGHFCGGSLIASNVVLTAAHCVDDGTVPWVHIGRLNRVGDDGSGFEIIQTERVVIHPQYNSGADYNNDVAILFLSRSSSRVTIPLATDDSCFEVTGKCSVQLFGWGRTTEGGSFADVLQKATTSSVGREACQGFLPWDTITNTMICAGEIGGGIDTCQGDSGGPMVLGGELVGVVSWGRGCAREESPGVYASVPKLRSWILGQLGGGGSASTGDPCECSTDGVSGGVATHRAGCKQHLISSGDTDRFCMVKGGPACSSAQPSQAFPGAYWKFCSSNDPCACTSNGISGGVQTHRIGCAQHLIQYGDHDRFCMVVGGSTCSSSRASSAFPGAEWKFC